MNKILLKTKEFIFAQQTNMLSSTLILSGMMVISRLAGFLRYRMLASYFSKEQLDIFFAAFRIPDLVFEILITGALSTTFIPFFIKYQKDKDEQQAVISSVMNIVTMVLFGAILVLALIMPFLVEVITPGFSAAKSAEVVFYSRILLLGQLPFLVMGNFLTGISQARKSFLIPAVVPIIYNFAIIATTFFFSHQLGLFAPIIGVVIGAFLFFVLQIPILLFAHFKYQFIIAHFRQAKQFFRTAIPRIMTTVVSQIDATIDLTLATLLGSGSYTVFYLAQHLQLLPVSIIGIAFGQASLPYLTEMYQNKRLEEFKKIIVSSMLNVFFLTIPFASFFIIARTPIVRLFFGGEKFDWDATVQTALTLSYFCLSLPLHAVYYFLTRCFYALFDTKTPFYISLVSIALNAGLSITFVQVLRLPVWYLAIAFSISMTIHVCILIAILYRKVGGFAIKHLLFETLKIIVAAFNTSVIIYFMLRLFDGLILDTSRTLNVLLLLIITGTAYIIIYLFLTWLFGIKEMYILTRMMLKMKEYQRKVLEVYKGVE